jgi:nucleoid-associated protein EbfC
MSGNEQADTGAMARQAQQLQGAMASIQSDLKDFQATGTARDGLVTATVSGEGRLVRLEIDPSVIDPRDPETLSDLVITAVDGAHQAMSKRLRERMSPVTDGLQDMLARLREARPPDGRVMPAPALRRPVVPVRRVPRQGGEPG